MNAPRLSRRGGVALRGGSLRAAALVALAGLSCSSRAELDAHMGEVARALREVERRGALLCAPRELAVARSHLQFAELERDRGSPARAREHLDVADENVRAAAELSPVGRCVEPLGPSGG